MRILILGSYGNFGKRIAEQLQDLPRVTLLLAGRNLMRAQQQVAQLQGTASAALQAVAMDILAADFSDQLQRWAPDVVIHTSGPFQQQSYRVAAACVAQGCHYIDLADDSRFVCGIQALDQAARDAGVLLVSGASSVPGLSAAVVDQCWQRFAVIDLIDIAIAPGNRAERGEATVRGILSYTGHGFPAFRQGQYGQAYGWMEPRRLDFGHPLGKRWLANVDVADVQLFPARYQVQQQVRFQAGLELPWLHLGMVAMAWLSRCGIVRDWARFTRPIMAASGWFARWGSDAGGMRVEVSGQDRQGQALRYCWRLTAEHGVGPYIPTLSAILVARKLVAAQLPQTGARPCLDLFTLAEFEPWFRRWGIVASSQWHQDNHEGHRNGQ
ncbi:saccharopine dehydrogenase family protein [Pokkaliibacter plantistimulans]|nr:saccharopine dehydrogenase NADP-binding domain-containing protein [Pokkaliibacter plantistimulans]